MGFRRPNMMLPPPYNFPNDRSKNSRTLFICSPNIRLQLPSPRLSVVGGIADAAGEEDELVGIGRREYQTLHFTPINSSYKLTL